MSRVKTHSNREWLVTLDLTVDEYYSAEQVKRALIRFPLQVVRLDIDPQQNPFGLALDCYERPPERITTLAKPAPATRTGLTGTQGDSR
jgi:integrating conjugative element protein (TIGR03746 family)